jgi:uncharacterized membrane protein
MADIITYMGWQNLSALLFFILCWVGYSQFADHRTQYTKSLLAITNEYRTQWMVEMIKRENRSMDVILIGNLQRSITFFANTTIFIVLGLISMLGYHDRFSTVISNVPFANVDTVLTWQIKIFLLILIFVYSFFKYTWSLRQYNYAGIFLSSVPPYEECRDRIMAISAKGGFLVGNAAKHFNNGLRAYYFGLAALSWFIHPYFFIAATTWVVYVTQRREYHSATLANLSR